MRLCCSFEIVEMGDEIVAVPVGENSANKNGILKLNPEGKEIFEMLMKGFSEEEIQKILFEKYENKSEIEEILKSFLDKLKEYNVLIDDKKI